MYVLSSIMIRYLSFTVIQMSMFSHCRPASIFSISSLNGVPFAVRHLRIRRVPTLCNNESIFFKEGSAHRASQTINESWLSSFVAISKRFGIFMSVSSIETIVPHYKSSAKFIIPK